MLIYRALVHFIHFNRFSFLCSPQRYFSCLNQSLNFAKLESKKLITISGQESTDFLQGLITNDIRHLLNNGSTSVTLPCIYSFMLTNTGRIIADLFIYKFSNADNLILLEVNEQLSTNLVKLLKRYKIHRKISISQNNDYNCFVLFPDYSENFQSSPIDFNKSELNTIIAQDPRKHNFGYKIISLQSKDNVIKMLSETSLKDVKITEIDEKRYRSFRYQYGIGEGVEDFPPESSFPLEANGDILNGISFQKGCYVGQELTTRIYHTGIIRKRMMPIKVRDTLKEEFEILPHQNIVDNGSGKTMGRFRANYQQQGLAVLKFNDVIPYEKNLKLTNSGYKIQTWRPFWWPESLVQQQAKLSFDSQQ